MEYRINHFTQLQFECSSLLLTIGMWSTTITAAQKEFQIRKCHSDLEMVGTSHPTEPRSVFFQIFWSAIVHQEANATWVVKYTHKCYITLYFILCQFIPMDLLIQSPTIPGYFSINPRTLWSRSVQIINGLFRACPMARGRSELTGSLKKLSNSRFWEADFFNPARSTNRITSNLSHGRPPFLNPLGRGEARVFARLVRSDSGFPSCYASFQNGVPSRKDSGFEGGADTRTKPNKNRLDWSENIQRKFEGIRSSSEFDSNVIDESDLHDKKHFDPRISTFLRIKIDWSDENENIGDSPYISWLIIQRHPAFLSFLFTSLPIVRAGFQRRLSARSAERPFSRYNFHSGHFRQNPLRLSKSWLTWRDIMPSLITQHNLTKILEELKFNTRKQSWGDERSEFLRARLGECRLEMEMDGVTRGSNHGFEKWSVRSR
jgi:hypothetical protein